jgi:hypothetical protein
MKRLSVLSLTLGVVILIAGFVLPSQAQIEYEVNFVLGQKMLDEDDWKDPGTGADLSDQPEFGVCSTFGKEGWPVQIALDLTASVDDVTLGGIEVEGSTSELAAGIRKIWKKNKARPFFGGGLAMVNGEFDIGGFSFDDDAVGYWIDGGVFWRLGRRFNLGIEARFSRAEITLFGVDGEAGGEHIGLILGFGKASD